MNTTHEQPKLAKPGAGLPFPQSLLARYWIFPRFCRHTSWEQAGALFETEGKKILDLITPLDQKTLTTPVLVTGVRGIEDSSRFWSPAMTVEHLVVTGDGMSQILCALSQGKEPPLQANIAAVKPKDRFSPEQAIEQYKAMLGRYRDRMKNEVGDRHSTTRAVHPWFGPMNAHQWHSLIAMHQGIHRRQIKAILGIS